MNIEGMCAHSVVTIDRSRTLQECAAAIRKSCELCGERTVLLPKP